MVCACDNDKLLIIAFQKGIRIFTEIERMRFVAMYNHHRAFQFIGIVKEFEIKKRKIGGDVPAVI